MPRRLIAVAAAAVLGLSASPGIAATPPRYHGKTADGRAVTFRANRSVVRSFRFQTRFVCSGRSGFVARATFPRVAVHRGRFATTFTTRDKAIRTTITGTIRGRRASGRIVRRATFNAQRRLDPAGRLVCRSNARWSAKR